jgi:hypothetical protein
MPDINAIKITVDKRLLVSRDNGKTWDKFGGRILVERRKAEPGPDYVETQMDKIMKILGLG